MSETTRLLIANGTVERYKEAGQRHYVYRWRDDAWAGCLQHCHIDDAIARPRRKRAGTRRRDVGECSGTG